MKDNEPICPYFDPDKKTCSRPGCWMLDSKCRYREFKDGKPDSSKK